MALPLSIAIVCKNSGATIERTLASVADLAGEIVVLDSGSTDNTLPIVMGFSPAVAVKVHKVTWQGHVKTKQAALEACSLPWILALDSDESLEPELQASVRAAVERDDPIKHGFTLNRKVWYRGRFLEHAWQPESRLRLVRRGRAHWMGIDPHDQLVLSSGNIATTVGVLSGDLRHDSIDTFISFMAKQVHYGELSAKGMLARGDRGSYWRLLTSPAIAFLKQMVLKQAFRDGWRGWLAAASTATAAAAKHAALIEMTYGREAKK